MNKSDNSIQKFAFTGVLVALISVSAFIRIPTPFVPITLQVFIVLLAPMIFGFTVSFTAIALYIVLGLIGFPVFATGGGIGYVFKPSFGFLIGYLLSTIPNSLISNTCQNFKNSKWKTAFTLSLGAMTALLVIYSCGLTGFYLNMNYFQGKEISVITAMKLSVAPFILFDLAKVWVAVVLAYKIKPALRYVLGGRA